MKEFMSNGFTDSIAQAIEEMKAEQGDSFSLDLEFLVSKLQSELELLKFFGISPIRLKYLLSSFLYHGIII